VLTRCKSRVGGVEWDGRKGTKEMITPGSITMGLFLSLMVSTAVNLFIGPNDTGMLVQWFLLCSTIIGACFD
jgi:hypothetical protein